MCGVCLMAGSEAAPRNPSQSSHSTASLLSAISTTADPEVVQVIF